ncbi:MAG TPA: DUF3006 domain-containing protein [Limnochordales bacterium]|nr:DUF3006 domain-containing protein [Limnochordales bacterium]
MDAGEARGGHETRGAGQGRGGGGGRGPAGTRDGGESRGEPAVVDRLVDGQWAVLLVGDSQVERVVPRTALPAAAREGTWLKTEWDGERLVWAAVDEAATRQAQERIADKLARLRQRGRR